MLHSSSEMDLEWESVGLPEGTAVNGKAFFSFVYFQMKQPVSYRRETIVSCLVSHFDPSSALVERNVLKPIPKRCSYRLPDAKI